MAKEAESHADEDKKRKELVETRNVLDSAVYQGEKLLKENKDKLKDDDQSTLQKALDEAKKVVDNKDATKDELEAAAKDLNERIMPIGAKLYESAPEPETKNDKNTETKKDKSDDSIEGEVVDKQKDK